MLLTNFTNYLSLLTKLFSAILLIRMMTMIKYIFKNYLKYIILITFFSSICAFLTLLLPDMFADIISIGIGNSNQQFIYQAGIKLIIISFFILTTSIISSYISNKMGSTSHMPFLAPPHWPLTKLLEQAVRGQMPPVRFRKHSPHCLQSCCRGVTPWKPGRR